MQEWSKMRRQRWAGPAEVLGLEVYVEDSGFILREKSLWLLCRNELEEAKTGKTS